MAKPNPILILAEKLVQTLRQQRLLGPAAYPLTVPKLVALADPDAPAELVPRALGKKPYAAEIIVANKKHPESPLALAEDASQLAASPLLLEFVLGQICTAESPLHALEKVIARVDKPLRPTFEAALRQQIADNTLPETVGVQTVRGKVMLYLKALPPPLSPAAELAQKLLELLRQAKAQGGAAYPTTLDTLRNQLEAPVKPPLFKQAITLDTFQKEVIRPVPAVTDAPLVLAEDRSLLVSSHRLLEYLLGGTTTVRKPLATVSFLKAHLVRDLQQAFEESVQTMLTGGTLPATVGVLRGEETLELYLLAQAAPAWILGQKLLNGLRAQRRKGVNAYPTPLDQLTGLVDAHASPALVKRALADKAVKDTLLAALPGDPSSPVLLAEDRDRVAISADLLLYLIASKRTPEHQGLSLVELKKPLQRTLQYTFATNLAEWIEQHRLPVGVGVIRLRKTPYVFLLQDLHLEAPPIQPAPAALPLPRPQVEIDFERVFGEAFERLDQERGSHNLVSLVGLRQAVPVERALFDERFQQLRREGRYSLSAAEGRHGVSAEEREAGFTENGTLLLYVSRRG